MYNLCHGFNEYRSLVFVVTFLLLWMYTSPTWIFLFTYIAKKEEKDRKKKRFKFQELITYPLYSKLEGFTLVSISASFIPPLNYHIDTFPFYKK